MRHRSGRFPRRLTPAGRITSSVTALGLLAAGGLAVVIGTSFAGGSANLVANPGFEKDTAGWSALKAPQHLDRVAGGHSGSYAAKLWSTSAGTVVLKDSPNSVTSTVKGAVYHVSAWVSTTTPSVDAVLRIREVGGAALVGQHSKQVRLKSGGWQELAFDYTAAASGDQLDYNVLARSLASGHSLLVDDAWLSVSSTPVSTPTTSKASPTTTATPSPPATPAPAPSDPPTVTPTPTQAPPPPPPVTSGTLFGTSVYQNTGETFAQAYGRRISEFGTLPVDRVFYPGLPSGWPGNAGYGGTTVSVSFKASPQQVLTGAYDATLTNWFQAAPRDRDIYWTYYHEPEDNIEAGEFTAADYRAAWTRIAALADKAQNP
ncbi:MAG: hypothetical protein ACXVXG_17920, partial [Nocardioidaceae bacterium]